jgi:hypothetical protein
VSVNVTELQATAFDSLSNGGSISSWRACSRDLVAVTVVVLSLRWLVNQGIQITKSLIT